MTALRRVESAARVVWPPLALSALLVVTWALVDGFGDVVYKDTAVAAVPDADHRPGSPDLQRQLGRPLVRPHRVHGDRRVHVCAADDPARDQEVHVPLHAHWLGSWILPGEAQPARGDPRRGGGRDALRLDHGRANRPAGRGRGGNRDARASRSSSTFSTSRRPRSRVGRARRSASRQTTTFVAVLVLGADLHRRRLRLPAVGSRAAASGLARERARRADRSAFASRSSARSPGCSRASSSESPARSTATISSRSAPTTSSSTRLQHRPAHDRDARRRRHDERHRGCCRLLLHHRVYEAFRRWEVNGLGGVTPPSGTANFVLAVILVVTLVLRPKGITGGRGDPVAGRLVVQPACTQSRPAQRPGHRRRRVTEVTSVMRATIWRQPGRPQDAARRSRVRRVAGGAAQRPPRSSSSAPERAGMPRTTRSGCSARPASRRWPSKRWTRHSTACRSARRTRSS